MKQAAYQGGGGLNRPPNVMIVNILGVFITVSSNQCLLHRAIRCDKNLLNPHLCSESLTLDVISQIRMKDGEIVERHGGVHNMLVSFHDQRGRFSQRSHIANRFDSTVRVLVISQSVCSEFRA